MEKKLPLLNISWFWAGGSHAVSYTHEMGLIPRQQCRKAPASVAEKGHILDLLIKPLRLPCFKSKALFRLQEGVELHWLGGFFSALKREAKMNNMSVVYSVGIAGGTGEMWVMIFLCVVTVQCSSRSFKRRFWCLICKSVFHLLSLVWQRCARTACVGGGINLAPCTRETGPWSSRRRL